MNTTSEKAGAFMYMSGIFRDSVWLSLALRLSAVGLGFLVNLVISRKLGAHGAGSYFIVFSVVSLVSLLARIGQDTLLVREVSVEIAHGRYGRVRRLLSRSAVIAHVGAAVGALSLFAVALPLAETVFNQTLLAPLFQIMSIAILLMTAQSVVAEALRGAGWVNASQLLLLVVAPLVTLILIWLLPGSLSVATVCWAAVTGLASAVTLALILAQFFLPISGRDALPQEYSFSSQIRKGWPLGSAALLTYLSTWADTLLLGTLVSPDVVGVYTVAARIAALGAVIKISLGAVVAPRLAAAYARGDMVKFRSEGIHYGRMAAMAGLPILLICFVLAKPLLHLFGGDFTSGIWILRVLLIGYAANYLLGFGGIALSMTNHAENLVHSIAVGLFFAVILILVLVPLFGGIGAAIAMSVGSTIMNAMSGYQCSKKSGARLDLFSRL
jgi:O-antigen/teichoic acid export membrane protein